MSKIRILVDGHWFDDLYQSPCVFLKGLYTAIADDPEFEIWMAANNLDQIKKEFHYSPSIQYVHLPSKSKLRRLSIDFPSIIKRLNIDIAHYQFISPLYKSAKEIVTVHDLLYKDFADYFPFLNRVRNDLLFKRSATRADLITTVSTYSKNAVVNHFDIRESRISVIPVGIGEDYFTFSPDKSVLEKHMLDQYIICVSRFEPRKNQVFLLKAYDELALWERGIKLVFVGRHDFPIVEFDQYLLTHPFLRDHVVILKNLTFRELFSLYAQAKVSVYPSLAEGFGIPPLESSALGGVTLCSNATAMSDFSFFGEYLFDPYDIESFKTKLMKAISTPDRALVKNISEAIRTKYNWNIIGRNFAAEVKKLF